MPDQLRTLTKIEAHGMTISKFWKKDTIIITGKTSLKHLSRID